MNRRDLLRASLAASLLPTILSTSRAADKYPSRVCKVVVPFAVGGNTDLVGRFYAQKFSELFGQQFIVENRTGSGVVVGSDHVAKSAPDGTTLLIGTSAHAVNASLYAKLPYDPVRDLRPVALLAEVPMVLSVPPRVPARDANELVALMRQQPGQYSFASSGNGGSLHTAAALLLHQQKLSALHVPYRGAGPALTDAMAGQVDFIIDPVSSSAPFIKAGRLRPLGVTTRRRSPLLPEVPTLQEQGFTDYETSTWNILLVPARVPDDIVKTLADAVARINAQPETVKALRENGLEVIESSPAHAAAYLEQERAKWAAVVKAGGIKLE